MSLHKEMTMIDSAPNPTPDLPAAPAADVAPTAPAVEIQIDPEFAGLIPPPTPEELADLEARLRAEGCRDPLVVWKSHGLLLDGHHRFELCRKLGIPFTTVEIDLPDREAARQWIVANQLARRNLTREAASYLRGSLYNARKQQGRRTDLTSRQNVEKSTTAEQLAAAYKVDPRTIQRDGDFAAEVDTLAANCGSEVKQVILAGDSPLTRKKIRSIARLPPEQQAEEVRKATANGRGKRGGKSTAARKRSSPAAEEQPGPSPDQPVESVPPQVTPGYAAVLGRLDQAIELIEQGAETLPGLLADARPSPEEGERIASQVRRLGELAGHLLRLFGGEANPPAEPQTPEPEVPDSGSQGSAHQEPGGAA
jgi:hypothetical protein